MEKRKHPKLRAWGRWQVWVCTAIFIVVTLGSCFVFPVVTLPNALYGDMSIGVVKTRLNIAHHELFGQRVVTQSASIDFISKPTLARAQISSWWSIPKWNQVLMYQYEGPAIMMRSIDLPLVYMTMLMMGLSYWLIRERRKIRRSGCCVDCGYSLDGLNSDVCPECGATHGEA